MERPEVISRGAAGVYLLFGLAALVSGAWPLLIIWVLLPLACAAAVLVQGVLVLPLMFLVSRLDFVRDIVLGTLELIRPHRDGRFHDDDPSQ